MNVYFLSYDINMSSSRMKRYLPNAQIACLCNLNNYELRFYDCNRKALASVEARNGKSVPAVIWRLEIEDIKLLDKMYDLENCFKKVRYQISGEIEIEAFGYVMRHNILAIPTEAYLAGLMDGYEEHEFDPTAVEDAMTLSLLKISSIE